MRDLFGMPGWGSKPDRTVRNDKTADVSTVWRIHGGRRHSHSHLRPACLLGLTGLTALHTVKNTVSHLLLHDTSQNK
jgi:hypothetical protein